MLKEPSYNNSMLLAARTSCMAARPLALFRRFTRLPVFTLRPPSLAFRPQTTSCPPHQEQEENQRQLDQREERVQAEEGVAHDKGEELRAEEQVSNPRNFAWRTLLGALFGA